MTAVNVAIRSQQLRFYFATFLLFLTYALDQISYSGAIVVILVAICPPKSFINKYFLYGGVYLVAVLIFSSVVAAVGVNFTDLSKRAIIDFMVHVCLPFISYFLLYFCLRKNLIDFCRAQCFSSGLYLLFYFSPLGDASLAYQYLTPLSVFVVFFLPSFLFGDVWTRVLISCVIGAISFNLQDLYLSGFSLACVAAFFIAVVYGLFVQKRYLLFLLISILSTFSIFVLYTNLDGGALRGKMTLIRYIVTGFYTLDQLPGTIGVRLSEITGMLSRNAFQVLFGFGLFDYIPKSVLEASVYVNRPLSVGDYSQDELVSGRIFKLHDIGENLKLFGVSYYIVWLGLAFKTFKMCKSKNGDKDWAAMILFLFLASWYTNPAFLVIVFSALNVQLPQTKAV